ncbi:MAG TPA: nucleotidyltransferase family protein [Pseudomonadales bacterium]
MVLAAGRGERLRPLTDRMPKPMVEVAGRPLLEHQLEWLRSAGIREVVINLHHLGQQIVDAFGDGRRHGVKIAYSLEPELLETGGGIVKALPLLGPGPFLVLNGDIYTDFPFTALPTGLDAGMLAHLVVTPRPSFRERGDFEVSDGRISARGDSYVYCGIALLHPALFDGRSAEPFSLRELFFAAIGRGALTAQVWDGYWTDIGTPERLDEVNARLQPGA